MTGTQATPGEDITVRGLTWPKLLAIVGAILGGAGLILVVLLTVVWGGIRERFDSLGKRVQGLDDTFDSAIASGTSVQDLITKAPRLEGTLNDTRTDVAAIRVQVTSLQGDMAGVTQQLQTIQQNATATQVAVSALQPAVAQLSDTVPRLLKILERNGNQGNRPGR